MYYPSGLNPIHPVQDWPKVRRMARMAIQGGSIPNILVDGENLLAGTHRAAANDLLERMGYDCRIEQTELEDIEGPVIKNAVLAAIEEDDYREVDNIWDQ